MRLMPERAGNYRDDSVGHYNTVIAGMDVSCPGGPAVRFSF